MGIGPTQPAWEADTLPLSYARIYIYIVSITYYATFVNQMRAVWPKITNLKNLRNSLDS